MAKAYIGTSGWIYSSWKGKFYPNDLAQARYLDFYTEQFNSVELNFSFYRLPKPSTYANWAAKVPENFLFAIKLSRYISHVKRLHNVRAAWRVFMNNAQFLEAHLGPILVQLPESFHFNPERLESFLKVAYKGHEDLRLVFEFRHESWFVQETYDLLSSYGAALCIGDSPKYPRHDLITAKFAYYRFHGREELFASNYSNSELKEEAKKMRRLLKKDIDVYAFFNNDSRGYAPKNAKTLAELLS